jgi:hypothetical protein
MLEVEGIMNLPNVLEATGVFGGNGFFIKPTVPNGLLIFYKKEVFDI